MPRSLPRLTRKWVSQAQPKSGCSRGETHRRRSIFDTGTCGLKSAGSGSSAVRFAESEYAVPRESLRHVIAELRRALPRLAEPVMFPVEVRVAARAEADPEGRFGNSYLTRVLGDVHDL